jgi:hypothetical protein
VPWWAWLIAAMVVWVTVVVTGVYLWSVKRITQTQQEIAVEFNQSTPGPYSSDHIRGHHNHP